MELKSVIFDFDNTIRISKGKEDFPLDINDIEILPNRYETIQKFKDSGYIITGVSNQSCIGRGKATYSNIIQCFEHTCKLLSQDIDYYFCPHHPLTNCICRKPKPFWGNYIINKYNLNPQQSIYVGDAHSDMLFAKNCNFQYYHPDQFFK